MTVSVIVPAKPYTDDIERAQVIKDQLSNYVDFIVSTEGDHPATARNEGARKARGTNLLFIDADMNIPKLDCNYLESFNYDLATAMYTSEYDSIPIVAQNVFALTGSPFSFYGGFMWVRSHIFTRLNGFRRMPAEDVEFANRAWKLGYRIEVFPFYVEHTRRFRWANAIGPTVTEEGIWGIP